MVEGVEVVLLGASVVGASVLTVDVGRLVDISVTVVGPVAVLAAGGEFVVVGDVNLLVPVVCSLVVMTAVVGGCISVVIAVLV